MTMLRSLCIPKILLRVCDSILGLENGFLGLLKLTLVGVPGSAGVTRAILQLGEVRFALLKMTVCAIQSFLSLCDGEIFGRGSQRA